MAQFGGQKNPPWATQFAATSVSQQGHSVPTLDLNSLHCECSKPGASLIPSLLVTQKMTYAFLFTVFIFVVTSPAPSLSTPTLPIHLGVNTSLNGRPYFTYLQLLVCSSHHYLEHPRLSILNSRPWLPPLSATNLLQTISCLSKMPPCSSRLQQLPQQHYSRSVTAMKTEAH